MNAYLQNGLITWKDSSGNEMHRSFPPLLNTEDEFTASQAYAGAISALKQIGLEGSVIVHSCLFQLPGFMTELGRHFAHCQFYMEASLLVRQLALPPGAYLFIDIEPWTTCHYKLEVDKERRALLSQTKFNKAEALCQVLFKKLKDCLLDGIDCELLTAILFDKENIKSLNQFISDPAVGIGNDASLFSSYAVDTLPVYDKLFLPGTPLDTFLHSIAEAIMQVAAMRDQDTGILRCPLLSLSPVCEMVTKKDIKGMSGLDYSADLSGIQQAGQIQRYTGWILSESTPFAGVFRTGRQEWVRYFAVVYEDIFNRLHLSHTTYDQQRFYRIISKLSDHGLA